MKIRLVGDIHGDYYTYRQLVEDSPLSIQVGDFGRGFDKQADYRIEEWLHEGENENHWFIRGNHDCPEACQESAAYLGDYGVFHGNLPTTIFYISGARSIDYYRRKEGRSWWPDEELSQEQFDACESFYLKMKPEIVISHDAPATIPTKMDILNPQFGGEGTTRTSYRLALMLAQHQPKWWFFGHWHKSGDLLYKGCNFKCLNINEVVDFDTKELKIV